MAAAGETFQSLTSYVTSIEGAVSIFGKVCLFFAVFLALRVGEILDEASARSIPEITIENTSGAIDGGKQAPLSEYDIITQRNIFGGEPIETAPTADAIPKTKLNLRLVGASVTKGGTPFAIIEETKKKEQDIFDLEEMVFGQAKLIEILPESVKLERGGSIEILLLEAGEGSSMTVGGDGGVEVSGDGTSFEITEEELNKELANLPRLLSQARAVPYFRDGQSVGMRLFAIRKSSLYDKLGLKNGDILREINGASLSDPSQALKLFEILKNERSINVILERKGEEKTLEYSIE